MIKNQSGKSPVSLESYFRRQSVRWSMAGFLVTLFLAVPCTLYSAKLSSERQLLIMAKSAARAFRPMILQQNIRDAEFQMRKALDLKPEESAIVLNPELKAIYPLQEKDKVIQCHYPDKVCWSPGWQRVTLLYPIFFDTVAQDVLFGYLEMTLQPSLDKGVLATLLFMLLAAFIGQAFGLSSGLTESARRIVDQLSHWAEYLRTNPSERLLVSHGVPFSELHPMQEAIDGLHFEIAKLRDEAARKATADAQFNLLREISHDLKTPLSLAAKYFALHLDTVKTTGEVNAKEVSDVERSLRRMREILRQAVFPLNRSIDSTVVSISKVELPASCDLVTETKLFLEDFCKDPEVERSKVTISMDCQTEVLAPAKVSPINYYRLLENLVRNAVEAVQPDTGTVMIVVAQVDKYPTLIIRDNGPGVAHELRNKIFAFDFTTKTARGTGLGLGIVDKICTECEATVHLKSELGQGAEFTIIFKPGLSLKPSDSIQEEQYHAKV